MHKPRKRFGQHFLHDQNVIRRTVDVLALVPGETVIEIGPGQGVLTAQLLEAGARVVAVEVDRDLVASLRERFHGQAFEVTNADVLKTDIGALMEAMAAAVTDAGGTIRLGTPMTALHHEGGRVTGIEVAGPEPGVIHAGAVVSAITPGLVVRAAAPAAPEGLLPPVTMRAVALVYLIADRAPVTDEAWIQVSDPRVPFSRIAEFVNWDPAMVPPGRTVLCAEVYGTGGSGDPWWSLDDSALARACAGAMADPLGWVDDQAAFRMLDVVRLPRAYPLIEAWRVDEATRAPMWLSGIEGLELARGGTVVTALEAGEAAADRAGGTVMAGAA